MKFAVYLVLACSGVCFVSSLTNNTRSQESNHQPESQLNFTASEFEQLDGRNFTETFANGTNSNDQLNITVRTGNYSYAYPEEIQLNNSTGVRYSEQVNYTEASVNGIVFQRNFSQNSSSPYHSEFNNFTSALEQAPSNATFGFEQLSLSDFLNAIENATNFDDQWDISPTENYTLVQPQIQVNYSALIEQLREGNYTDSAVNGTDGVFNSILRSLFLFDGESSNATSAYEGQSNYTDFGTLDLNMANFTDFMANYNSTI